jgi:hypothetical protein
MFEKAFIPEISVSPGNSIEEKLFRDEMWSLKNIKSSKHHMLEVHPPAEPLGIPFILLTSLMK